MAYQYVTEPPSALECVICLEVAEDPWQHGQCGRLLCKGCKEKLGRNQPCPNCRGQCPQYFEDNRSKREIKALPIKCPIGGCGQTMERQQVDEHVYTECPHTVMLCKYGDIGCAAELKRGEMAAHEQDDKLHLQMAQDTVITLKEETRRMKNNGSVTYVVSNFQKKRQAKKWQDNMFHGSPFYTHPNGYFMTLTVYANGYGKGEGTHVGVAVPILKGKYDAGLKWPFVGKYTFTLPNQLEDNNHKSMTAKVTAAVNRRVGDPWGFDTFISHTALAHDPVKNTQYLKDDTLYFRLSVEVADHKPWLQ